MDHFQNSYAKLMLQSHVTPNMHNILHHSRPNGKIAVAMPFREKQKSLKYNIFFFGLFCFTNYLLYSQHKVYCDIADELVVKYQLLSLFH